LRYFSAFRDDPHVTSTPFYERRILSLSGEESAVGEAFSLLEAIKGEEQFGAPRLISYIREPEAAPQR